MPLTTKVLSLKEIIQHRRSYFEILTHLTHAPLLDVEKIGELYTQATIQGSHFIGCMDNSGDLVGVGTLLVEQKFIRDGGKV
jgi:hypothetical protein